MTSLPRPRRGVLAAVAAALLFGVGTPIAKHLMVEVGPWMMAALLYLGSGLGLSVYRRTVHAAPVRLAHAERGWFIAAIAAGGVVAPVLLMVGLVAMPASTASLLLNAESALTALVAWLAFHEYVGRRIAAGLCAILAGALVLAWPDQLEPASMLPALAVLGACLCWAIDNNLTRKVALADPTWVAATKGWVAGAVNVALALATGSALPRFVDVAAALGLGFFAYGVSLTLFVVGLRELGAARTGGYFALAPFFGAAFACVLGEPVTPTLLGAGALMAWGLWLHLTERHVHVHAHAPLEHSHAHVHDEHHQHPHDPPLAAETRHTHWHQHAPLTHRHAHYPDAHHAHYH